MGMNNTNDQVLLAIFEWLKEQGVYVWWPDERAGAVNHEFRVSHGTPLEEPLFRVWYIGEWGNIRVMGTRRSGGQSHHAPDINFHFPIEDPRCFENVLEVVR